MKDLENDVTNISFSYMRQKVNRNLRKETFKRKIKTTKI